MHEHGQVANACKSLDNKVGDEVGHRTKGDEVLGISAWGAPGQPVQNAIGTGCTTSYECVQEGLVLGVITI